MSVRSAARRHREELGEVLAVASDRPGPLVIGLAVALWAAFSALTLIRPAETALMALTPSLVFAVLLVLVLLLVSGERLLVCERGLVIGSVAPGLRPYVLRYAQIVPGSVVPVTGAGRYGPETGTGALPQSTVRRSAWTRQGVHLVGPSAQEARRHRAVLAPLQDPPPRSIDGRWVWFAGTGRTPPERITAVIARAAGACGAAPLARATAAAPVRALTGRREDCAAHLPGTR